MQCIIIATASIVWSRKRDRLALIMMQKKKEEEEELRIEMAKMEAAGPDTVDLLEDPMDTIGDLED